VAIVVEAAVGKDGTVSVPRVDMAVDCGFAAYPDRIRSQMEGAAVMALSSALYGEITFREGRAEQNNFNDFQVARMDVAPRETHVYIIESDAPPGGVGEPGVPPFAPALWQRDLRCDWEADSTPAHRGSVAKQEQTSKGKIGYDRRG